ncbi:MAG: lipocalin-like domain-containing protein [Cyanobacteria bacterium P01_H01_bin.74]
MAYTTFKVLAEKGRISLPSVMMLLICLGITSFLLISIDTPSTDTSVSNALGNHGPLKNNASEKAAASPRKEPAKTQTSANTEANAEADTPFQLALPGYQYQFPADHAAHPQFKTEWWYYTGHLKTPDQKNYGYELTFFRIGQKPVSKSNALQNTLNQIFPSQASMAWQLNAVYATHFAISDETEKTFYYAETLNRQGVNIAGARTSHYHVWNGLWQAELLDAKNNTMTLEAQTPDGKNRIHLLLSSEKPPVIHGKPGAGVSQKADCVGCASHYYSLTRLNTTGTLLINNQLSPVSGLSWMDHEFGSSQLSAKQTGWDWFSIQFNNNTELMLYLLRHADGSVDPNSSGTLVWEDGHSQHLALDEFTVTPSGKIWTSPSSGGTYPMGWTIRVPEHDIDVSVTPSFENQELKTSGTTQVSYWEGSAAVAGKMGAKQVTGQAYVEMTGYDKQQTVKQKL